jgi:exoribonuclease-2
MNDLRTDSSRARLRALAVAAMRARGLEPDFPPDAVAQAASVAAAPRTTEEPLRDLRALPWCSIDNDDSRDLDQLSVAERLAGGGLKMRVAVADVDAAVPRDSAVDRHAALNTTSVYTAAAIFPMLPARFSTDLTSLNAHQDRLSLVVEYVVAPDGSVDNADVYGATVRNQAQLTYDGVNAWLTRSGPLPQAAAAVPGMDAQLRIQDELAQALDRRRHELGALEFAVSETRVQFDGDTLSDLHTETPSRAKSLIENLMIAANGVVARFLDGRGFPCIRRVVRAPERWERIVALAAQTGDSLPPAPDVIALSNYLVKRKTASPDQFSDLSHTIIRLLGSGEYVVDMPGGDAPGHFGLAVKDYTHSTAPNRRYSDLVTQRLVKAALAGHQVPYGSGELERLAAHCTLQEDAANKVERQVRKSAAAMLVSSRVGQRFDAVVTGASPKGTYVRVRTPPIEGKLMRGERGLDVGDRITVQLTHVDVDKGFIDFAA